MEYNFNEKLHDKFNDSIDAVVDFAVTKIDKEGLVKHQDFIVNLVTEIITISHCQLAEVLQDYHNQLMEYLHDQK